MTKGQSDEGPMLETLDHTIRIGSTPTFIYIYTKKLKKNNKFNTEIFLFVLVLELQQRNYDIVHQ